MWKLCRLTSNAWKFLLFLAYKADFLAGFEDTEELRLEKTPWWYRNY